LGQHTYNVTKQINWSNQRLLGENDTML